MNSNKLTLKQIIENHPELEKHLEAIAQDFFEDGIQYGKNDKPHLVGDPAPINDVPDFFDCWKTKRYN